VPLLEGVFGAWVGAIDLNRHGGSVNRRYQLRYRRKSKTTARVSLQITLFFRLGKPRSRYGYPAAGVAGDDSPVFHFVNPITGFGDHWIVGDQKKRFLVLLHDSLQ
jgi:hypothetical protein